MYQHYDDLSLGNRYSTFRDKLVVSYLIVDNVKNISFHEDVFAIFSEKSITNYPVTQCHI